MPTKSACKILAVCYNQNHPNTEQGQRGPQCKSCGPRSDSGDKSIKRTKEILLLHKGVRHPLDGGAVRFCLVRRYPRQHRTIPALRQAPLRRLRHGICVAKMLDKTSSIICAFGLASAVPRSPYRHLELCGIALREESRTNMKERGAYDEKRQHGFFLLPWRQRWRQAFWAAVLPAHRAAQPARQILPVPLPPQHPARTAVM